MLRQALNRSDPALSFALCAGFFLAGLLGTALPAQGETHAPKPAHEPLSFALPVDCIVGVSCYIQNFVDTDPGPLGRDFRCNPLSYDGHKGTDFALPSLARMAKGVHVRAAADGRVRAVRDGMQDSAFSNDPQSVVDRECGNGLVIEHGNGWETQYCHLRRGSLLVKPGQEVQAATPLGLIGESGKASFPHLHFEVRVNGRVVDPFNPAGNATCAAPASETLWQSPAPAYIPGGIIAAGFAAQSPDYQTIRAGAATATGTALPPSTGQISLWGYAFGARSGDTIILEIAAPDGTPVLKKPFPVLRHLASLTRVATLPRPETGWQTGRYTGTVTLQRHQHLISRRNTTVTPPP